MLQFCVFGVVLPLLQLLQLLQLLSVHEDQYLRPPAPLIRANLLFLAIIAAFTGILIVSTPHYPSCLHTRRSGCVQTT